MAAIRGFCLLLALAAFFLIGAPLQWFVVRRVPHRADRIPLVFCRTLLWLVGVRVAVEGARVTRGPALMVANHVSWIDILALGTIMPFCFLAKSEVSRWPILSAFAEVQGTVFVDRRRKRSIPSANRAMARRMREGRSVLLFPEGTTVAGAEPGPFRSSHFAAASDLLAEGVIDDHYAVPIQPVAIAYSSPVAAWVGDDALLPHLWRVLCAGPFDCFLTFAAPIAFEAGSDRKRMARATRAAIVDSLGERSPASRNMASRQDHPSRDEEPLGEPAATGGL